MPTTGYDEDAERINRPRGPWWHRHTVRVSQAALALLPRSDCIFSGTGKATRWMLA